MDHKIEILWDGDLAVIREAIPFQGQVHYSAWEPATEKPSSFAGRPSVQPSHSRIQRIDGKLYGQIGTAARAPEEVEAKGAQARSDWFTNQQYVARGLIRRAYSDTEFKRFRDDPTMLWTSIYEDEWAA